MLPSTISREDAFVGSLAADHQANLSIHTQTHTNVVTQILQILYHAVTLYPIYSPQKESLQIIYRFLFARVQTSLIVRYYKLVFVFTQNRNKINSKNH